MKELMDVDDDDNEMYCATILYNLSHCDIEARLNIVHENAVPLLINLAKSTKERTIIASLGSSLLLSLCSPLLFSHVRNIISDFLAFGERPIATDIFLATLIIVWPTRCDEKIFRRREGDAARGRGAAVAARLTARRGRLGALLCLERVGETLA